MAVAGLSMRRILETLQGFPEGIPRRDLLDRFAERMVTERSTPGAKGRLARRLYGLLEKLGRKGLVESAEGRVALAAGVAQEVPRPLLGTALRRLLFLALLAEDRNADGPEAPGLVRARRAFLAAAAEEGWTDPQVARELGIPEARLRSLRELPAAGPCPEHVDPTHLCIRGRSRGNDHLPRRSGRPIRCHR